MFDIPGREMMSPLLGSATHVIDAGIDAGGAIAGAAGSAWDFGMGAIENLGGINPSLMGGPFMPSLGARGPGAGAAPRAGGAAAAAGGAMADPMVFGMMDTPGFEHAGGTFSPQQEPDWLY